MNKALLRSRVWIVLGTVSCLVISGASAVSHGPKTRPGGTERRAADPSAVSYNCGWLALASRPPCSPGDDPLARLVAVGDLLSPHNVESTGEVLAHAAAILRADSLPITERIVIQNAVLRVAIDAEEAMGYEKDRARLQALAALAARLVARLALPASKLAELGEEPTPALDLWIGPRSEWRERKTLFVPLLHEQVFRYARAFRPVHSGGQRAIFNQLLAVDTEWRTHVTPIVGRIEMRRNQRRDAQACVVLLDLASLRCGTPAGLHAVPFEQLPPEPFLFRPGPGLVGCRGCHNSMRVDARSPNPFEPSDLSAGEAPSELARRRRMLLEAASRAIAAIRSCLAEPPSAAGGPTTSPPR